MKAENLDVVRFVNMLYSIEVKLIDQSGLILTPPLSCVILGK